jgi:stress-induced-phosphoprotein 1
MADKQKAIEAKQKGNAAFTSGNFDDAVKHFSDAIKHDPNDHVLYSNRSGAYASLEKYQLALQDADMCVKLNPSWPKVSAFSSGY